MATWKKVIVSGSNVSQLNNDAGYLTTGTLVIPNSFSTASFNGINLLADSPTGSLNFASSSGQGLTISANAGTDTLTFGLSAIPNTSLANSTISGVALGGTLFALTAGSGLSSDGTYTGATARTFTLDTGSAHFQGGARSSISLTTTGNSGASTYTTSTGVLNVPNYTLAGLGGVPTTRIINTTNGITGGGSLANDLTLELTGQALALHNLATNGVIVRTGAGTVAARTITGTTNQITVTDGNGVSGNPTISLPNDLTVPANLTVPGNLTVIGTASFQNTTNLEVADRFVLLASGSNTTGDGGIVVQQATQNIGELFGYDSTFQRWGVTGSFVANQSNYVPDAFMAAVTTLSSANPNTSGPAAKYSVVGNIYVSSGDESIWIYS
jgi:hypothetical protein